MSLVHAKLHGSSFGIASEQHIGDLNLQKALRFGVSLYFYDFSAGSGTISLRIEFKDSSETSSYGSVSQNLSRSPSGTGDFRHELSDHFFMPASAKAKFYLTSSVSGDTAIGYDVFLFDPNYPTVDAEFRDSESVPGMSSGTTLYESGNAIGTQITFNVGTNRGSLVACRVLDKDKNTHPLELWLFRASTTGTGLGNDAPFTPSDTQLANLAGVVRINDWFANAENSIGQATNLRLSFTDLTNDLLYAWLVSRDGETYTSSSALTVQLEVLRD
jgi:hypothetical protein